jgi:hypothetical protein
MCSTAEATPELQGFSPPGDKKKGLANPTKGFLRFKKTHPPYLNNKKVKSRQI